MNHVKDKMWELNPKIVFGGPIPKMEGLSKCQDGRCSSSECYLINTNLVLDPRQAPEYSKPPIFYKFQLELYLFDVLSYRSCLEPPDAYVFPCPEIYLEFYVGPRLNMCLVMLIPVEVG
jgi:hypothetical protein